MNPKKLSVRMDRVNGNLVLTEERYRKAPRVIVDITNHVYLAMCADLLAEENTTQVQREIKFSDGFRARITVEVIPKGTDETDEMGAADAAPIPSIINYLNQG